MKLIESPKDGDRLDLLNNPYPTLFEVVGISRTIAVPHATHYGYVVAGAARIDARRSVKGTVHYDLEAKLKAGSFFSIPADVHIELDATDPTSLVVVITRLGFKGLLSVGATERAGRLSYIDGCSDTILVPPPRQGDPCLNYLHFPRGILQTQHTHPTLRAGIVARGKGHAFRLPSAGHSAWTKPLSAGAVFVLEPQEIHSFRTDESDEEMDVIAFHPDSDVGPTDAAHPMISRTYIDHGKK